MRLASETALGTGAPKSVFLTFGGKLTTLPIVFISFEKAEWWS